MFPEWADVLGLGDVRLVACDLPLHAPRDEYRAVVDRIRRDAHAAGALITTHKIDLFEACRDMFDAVDRSSELCGEASCLGRRGSALHAFATDPISSARAMSDFFRPQPEAEIMCLGGGGAATAITVRLAENRFPGRMTVMDVDPRRLSRIRAVHQRLSAEADIRFVEGGNADSLVTALTPGSLVINATGMGKDLPGSPITDAARFPEHAYAWDLNYRGDLQFLRQARDQKVRVEDGWRYFIHGWAVVIGTAFDIEVDAAKIAKMAAVAESTRRP